MKLKFKQTSNVWTAGDAISKYFEGLGCERVYSADDADFLVVPGGLDVNPSFYGDEEIVITRPGSEYSDSNEFEDVRKFALEGKKIIGICRGAQLLCVAAGGHLIQHIRGHLNNTHPIILQDGATITVNSNHHQMMYPYTLERDEYSIIGWSRGLSGEDVKKDLTDKSKAYTIGGKMFDQGLTTLVSEDDLFNNKIKAIVEPEIVIFHSINGLAIQYHPERMSSEEFPAGSSYSDRIIMGFLLNEL